MTQNNLINHVVSLELAKQLKEAGYPQESLFYWVGLEGGGTEVRKKNRDIEKYLNSSLSWGNSLLPCAAPTSSELGEQLPQHFYDQESGELTWYSYLSINGWNVDFKKLESLTQPKDSDAKV